MFLDKKNCYAERRALNLVQTDKKGL
jgi:hypothetical protein